MSVLPLPYSAYPKGPIAGRCIVPLVGLCLVSSTGSFAGSIPFDDPTALDNSFPGAAALTFADLDGDGDLDALAAGDGEVALWLNDGGGVSWTRQSVDMTVMAPSSLVAADLDGDGDLDVATAASRG